MNDSSHSLFWGIFSFTLMLTSHPFFVQDKILQSTGRGRSVTVTNDGATILKSLHIDNPAAKVLVGILSFEYWKRKEVDFFLWSIMVKRKTWKIFLGVILATVAVIHCWNTIVSPDLARYYSSYLLAPFDLPVVHNLVVVQKKGYSLIEFQTYRKFKMMKLVMEQLLSLFWLESFWGRQRSWLTWRFIPWLLLQVIIIFWGITCVQANVLIKHD